MENWKAPKYEIKRNRLAWNVSVNTKRAAAKLERAYKAAGFDTRVEAIFVYTTAMEWDEFAAKCEEIYNNTK